MGICPAASPPGSKEEGEVGGKGFVGILGVLSELSMSSDAADGGGEGVGLGVLLDEDPLGVDEEVEAEEEED